MVGGRESSSTFGALLKGYRRAAGFSQEALAERAGLTAQGIGALERGLRTTPHRDTVQLLAQALELSPEDVALLEATVRRRQGPAPSASPPPAAPSATLPVMLTTLVGRHREQQAVTALLREEDVRLLTLTGPGGVGKTSLAVQVAAGLDGVFAQGVVFVGLAGVSEAALLPATIARALGLRDTATTPEVERLRDHLHEKQMLLVLDNFEQIAPAATDVCDLLAGCPRLKVLATSRAALRVRGEREFIVPPLDVPARGAPASAEQVARYPAVALLVQCAQAVVPEFAVTAANAPAVAEICRRLDGLPLAIELAAARIKLLPPTALLARLERRLPLLTGGAQDLPPRQQTLRAAFAWSYELLDAHEQRLFRHLAVFVGGCTLDAAAAVLAGAPASGWAPDAEPDIALLEGLSSLVDKSLLRQVEQMNPSTGAAQPRLVMLQTVREFAGNCLAASGEAAALHRGHALHYLALAEHAATHLRGPAQRAWREHLDQEHDNLRAALGLPE